MKCPHCKKEISQHDMAKAMGKEGGKKSRRVLTSEQAKAMVEGRIMKKAKLADNEIAINCPAYKDRVCKKEICPIGAYCHKQG